MTERTAAQASAAETVATYEAALSEALQEDVASAMVASALRGVGCVVRHGTTLEANGLSDFELAAAVARSSTGHESCRCQREAVLFQGKAR